MILRTLFKKQLNAWKLKWHKIDIKLNKLVLSMVKRTYAPTLIDIDTKFFSQVEQHDEDLYLAIKNINHIKTKAVTLKYM